MEGVPTPPSLSTKWLTKIISALAYFTMTQRRNHGPFSSVKNSSLWVDVFSRKLDFIKPFYDFLNSQSKIVDLKRSKLFKNQNHVSKIDDSGHLLSRMKLTPFWPNFLINGFPLICKPSWLSIVVRPLGCQTDGPGSIPEDLINPFLLAKNVQPIKLLKCTREYMTYLRKLASKKLTHSILDTGCTNWQQFWSY